MSVRLDTVMDELGVISFQGFEQQVVDWLEDAINVGEIPFGGWWVSVGETGDFMQASQYLDLAT